ncbi:MAG TPA: hypothetical protein QGF35_08765, partial [Dehalococcoidia bacterium]|nr:hypothetical protein [Dehalococcoidia bacterium]
RSWGPRAGLVMFRSVRSGIRRTKSLTRPGGAGWTVEPLSEFGDNYEEFFRAAVPQFDCICVRDREYLNWRYIDPRGGWFRSFQALDLMGVILGYVVTKVTESRGIIVDLLALPGRDEIVQALASRAVDELEFAKVPVTTCWLPASHPYQSSLRSLGFVTWYADTLVKYRELREGQQFQELLDDPRTRVHFMEGDLDFV